MVFLWLLGILVPGGIFEMPQRAEYKAVMATNITELNRDLAVAASQGWKPILITMGASIVVILEHMLGE
jgi:hypothetical protein